MLTIILTVAGAVFLYAGGMAAGYVLGLRRMMREYGP